MSYYGGPCWSCIEKSCKNCPCAVCSEYDSVSNYVKDSQMMAQAIKNKKDCNIFIERLYKEVNDFFITTDDGCDQILAVKWRGFPAGFEEKELEYWMDARHSEGYGYIYENVSV